MKKKDEEADEMNFRMIDNKKADYDVNIGFQDQRSSTGYPHLEFGRYFSWQKDKENTPFHRTPQSYVERSDEIIQRKTCGGGLSSDRKLRNEPKIRHKTSPKQLSVLERVSETILKPDRSLRLRLSSELGMTQRQVQIWFQNKRAKLKKLKESGGLSIVNINKRGKKRSIEKTSMEESELYSTLVTPVIEHSTQRSYESNSPKNYSNMQYSDEQYYYHPHSPHFYPSFPHNYYTHDERYDQFDSRYLHYATGQNSFEEQQEYTGISQNLPTYSPREFGHYHTDNMYFSRYHPYFQDGSDRK